jgi:3',5'-cyclic AMP phosphodiesterase CpdA
MNMRRGQASPRAVLLGAMLFIVAGFLVFFASPWILPVRIVEGPLVQAAGPDEVTLVWYTSRPVKPGDCLVTLGAPPDSRDYPAEANDTRQRVRITGLTAGTAHPYRIQLGRRTLAEATLRTNRASGEPFAFIAFGDSGLGTREQYLLAQRMRSLEFSPDFLLHTGDVVYKRGERNNYEERFFAPYRDLLSQITFWPTLGNHDVLTDQGGPYLGIFELPHNGPADLQPETNYWFDYGSARIVVLDSTLPEATLAEKVAPWLKQTLAAAPATWKFVVFHHPPYTCGAHPSDERIQRAIVPAMEAAGVDLVFCGHDHLYERTHPLRGGQVVPDGTGITYIVTGAGGARLYEAPPPDQRPAYVAELDNSQHSFTYVQVDGLELRVRQIGLNGATIDDWRWSKPRPPMAQSPQFDSPSSQPAEQPANQP